MSVVRQGDLVVAIGTGGRSPALATYLTAHVGEELGPEYGTLLDLLSEAREAMRAAGRSSEDADWQRAFDSGILDLVRAGRVAEAKELLEHVSLIVVGLNHRNAPVDLLERMTVPARALPKALHDLAAREHLAEVVVLSTCNRTEVYARATQFHPGVGDVARLPRRHRRRSTPTTSPTSSTRTTTTPRSRTSSRVAAGLDSMIVGESEILGQVREAWRIAEHEGTAGPLLSRMFRHAVESGKRARTETGIGRHAVSISSAAVTVAAEQLGSLEGRRVLVIGAGDDGRGHGASRSRARASGEIVVANRTPSRGRGARRAGRRPSRSRSTTSPTRSSTPTCCCRPPAPTEVLIERADIEMVMERRDGRAAARRRRRACRATSTPASREVTASRCSTSTTSRALGEQSLQQRRAEIGKVREILTDRDRALPQRARRRARSRRSSPRCATRGEDVRAGRARALPRQARRPRPATRATRRRRSRRASSTSCCTSRPCALKDAAGTPRGELYADALGALFELDLPDADE